MHRNALLTADTRTFAAPKKRNKCPPCLRSTRGQHTTACSLINWWGYVDNSQRRSETATRRTRSSSRPAYSASGSTRRCKTPSVIPITRTSVASWSWRGLRGLLISSSPPASVASPTRTQINLQPSMWPTSRTLWSDNNATLRTSNIYSRTILNRQSQPRVRTTPTNRCCGISKVLYARMQTTVHRVLAPTRRLSPVTVRVKIMKMISPARLTASVSPSSPRTA